MSRHDSAPTHAWVIGSKINKWLAGTFILLIIVLVIVLSSITYAVRRDCNDFYKRQLHIGGYWINLQIGSTDTGCAELIN